MPHGAGLCPMPGVHQVAAPYPALNSRGKPHATHVCCPPANLVIWWGIQFWKLSRESPDPSVFPYMVGRGLPFQVDFKSVVGIKPGNSGVVIGNHVDRFTCIRSAEHFVVQSHICPVFKYKVSSVTHFPLEPECEDY